MNAMPVLTDWGHWIGWLAIQGTVLVCLAELGQRLTRSATFHRALWQAALFGFLLATAAALAGLPALRVHWPQPDPPPVPVNRPPAIQWLPPAAPVEPPPIPHFEPLRLTSLPPPAAPVPVIVARPVWWPGWLWLAGATLLAVRVLGGRGWFRLREARCPEEDGLTAEVKHLAHQLGLRRPVRVVASPRLRGPVAYGLWRCCIGLPDGFVARFPLVKQRVMLLHELAHHQARDPLWRLVADLAGVLLWWHPAVWWAQRQLFQATELAADEASGLVRNGPALLAECLVNLGREMPTRFAPLWLGIQGNGYRSGLARRVTRLLTNSPAAVVPKRCRWKLGIGLIGCTGLALVASASLIPFGAPAATASSLAGAWRQSLAGVTISALSGALSAERSIQSPPEGPGGTSGKPTQNSPGERPSTTPVGDHPGPPANQVPVGPQLAALQWKLDRIVLDTVTWTYAMTLRAGLIDLHKQSLAADPQKTGVNFIIRSPSKLRPAVSQDRWIVNDEIISPTASTPTSKGLGDSVVLPALTLTKVSLRQALQAMVKVAESTEDQGRFSGLNYTLEDSGIVISSSPASSNPLYLKTFRVNPRAFLQAIRDVSPPVTNAYAIPSGRLITYVPSAEIDLGLQALDKWLGSNDAPGLRADSPIRSGDSLSPSGAVAQGRARVPVALMPPSELVRIQYMIRRFFELATGIQFTTPRPAVTSGASNPGQYESHLPNKARTIYFNDRTGYLLVRATLEELDLVGKALEALNLTPANPPGQSGDQLFTKVFKIGTNQHLSTESLRSFLSRATGIDLDPSATPRPSNGGLTGELWSIGLPVAPQTRPSIFFRERTGYLTVRATLAELDRVEKALEELKAAPVAKSAAESPPDSSSKSRVFRVDRPMLVRAIRRLGGRVDPTHSDRQLFLQLVADAKLQPPKAVLVNERTGTIMLRDTQRALDRIWATLGQKGTAPATVHASEQATNANHDHLYLKQFKVNPNTFIQGIEDALNPALSPQARQAELDKKLRDLSQWLESNQPPVGLRYDAPLNRTQPAPGALPPLTLAPERGAHGFSGGTRPTQMLLIQEEVRQVFTEATGIEFGPRVGLNAAEGGGRMNMGVSSTQPTARSLFFNDRTGDLLVRATLAELELVEAAVETLTSPPPEVNVAITFLRLPNDSELARSRLLPLLRTNGVAVLTAHQTRALLKAMETPQGVELTRLPSVTTLSGRMLEAMDLAKQETILLPFEPRGITNMPTPAFEARRALTGYVLGATPVVLANNSILVTPEASFTEFLGYYVEENPDLLRTQRIMPGYVRWSAKKSATLWSGQALLCGPLAPTPGYVEIAPTLDEALSQQPNKRLPLVADLETIRQVSHGAANILTNRFVLVTATLVDPAGNAIHPPADPNSFPPPAEQ